MVDRSSQAPNAALADGDADHLGCIYHFFFSTGQQLLDLIVACWLEQRQNENGAKARRAASAAFRRGCLRQSRRARQYIDAALFARAHSGCCRSPRMAAMDSHASAGDGDRHHAALSSSQKLCCDSVNISSAAIIAVFEMVPSALAQASGRDPSGWAGTGVGAVPRWGRG